MPSQTTFLVPNFTKSVENKVSDTIEVISSTVLRLQGQNNEHFAIASSGFPSRTDGVYVVAMKVLETEGNLTVGFTATETFVSQYRFDNEGYFMSLRCRDGCLSPGRESYLPEEVTQHLQEIVSIFTISNNGSKKQIMWIVDGNEGDFVDCMIDFDFEDEVEIFPYVSMARHRVHIEFISFDRIKSRSPKIDEFMQKMKFQLKHQTIASSTPSTSNAENEALISLLRDQVSLRQDAAVKGRDETIRNLQQQLTFKDQQLAVKDQQHRQDQQSLSESKEKQLERILLSHRADLEISHQQLELERAEHQKTRNSLHQTKMELKDMEMFYLMREKESGQRRQREEENAQFTVKQEPGIEPEKQETKKKSTKKK